MEWWVGSGGRCVKKDATILLTCPNRRLCEDVWATLKSGEACVLWQIPAKPGWCLNTNGFTRESTAPLCATFQTPLPWCRYFDKPTILRRFQIHREIRDTKTLDLYTGSIPTFCKPPKNQTTGKHRVTIWPHCLKMTWDMPILATSDYIVRMILKNSDPFYGNREGCIVRPWAQKNNSIQWSSIYNAGSTNRQHTQP